MNRAGGVRVDAVVLFFHMHQRRSVDEFTLADERHGGDARDVIAALDGEYAAGVRALDGRLYVYAQQLREQPERLQLAWRVVVAGE